MNEYDPAEPHPEVPIDDDGQPVHPNRDIPICGRPKENPAENLYPYCTRSSFWVLKTGFCFEHQDRREDSDLFQ